MTGDCYGSGHDDSSVSNGSGGIAEVMAAMANNDSRKRRDSDVDRVNGCALEMVGVEEAAVTETVVACGSGDVPKMFMNFTP